MVRHPDFCAANRARENQAVHADGTRVCMDPDAGAWRVEREGNGERARARGGGALAVDLGTTRRRRRRRTASSSSSRRTEAPSPPTRMDASRSVRGRCMTPRRWPRRRSRATRSALSRSTERRALRFDDGTTPSREEEAHAADGDASEARIDGDASEVRISSVEASRVSIASKEETRALGTRADARSVCRPRREISELRQFEDLDPPPPPEDEDDENGEDDAKEDENVAEENENAEEENAEEGNAEEEGNWRGARASAASTPPPPPPHPDAGPPPPIPIVAPFVSPRMFVVYPDEECYFEVLSERAFHAYSPRLASRIRRARRPASLVAGPEPDVTNGRFSPPRPRPRVPARPRTSPRRPHVCLVRRARPSMPPASSSEKLFP